MFEIFLLIGIILFAGFLAEAIFQRTRVSPVLVLISLGFLLGPASGVIDASNGSALGGLTQFVGALAFIILLFDGGIKLNVFDLVSVLPKATLFTLTVFVLSVLFTAAAAQFYLGWSVWNGILLGAAVGGTSSAIVIALAEKSRVTEGTQALLTLESTLTDVLCIVSAFIVIQLMKSSAPLDAQTVLNLFAGSFSIAILAGIIAAVVWLVALKKVCRDSFPYMLTLATAFVLYAAVEAAKANGLIAVFAFGLVLGNAKRVTEALRLKTEYALGNEIPLMQEEVTFFTRTFFFVFLGLILNLGGITQQLAIFSIGLAVLFGVARWLGARAVLGPTDAGAIISMMPRGLAAAVLAGLPAAEGLEIPGFTDVALLVIVLTNIIATVGVFAYANGAANNISAQTKLSEHK